jgi:N-acetylneuraminic acid mutarotase
MSPPTFTTTLLFASVATSMSAATTFELIGTGCCKNEKGRNPSTATFAPFQNVQTLGDCGKLCEAEPLCTAIEFSTKKLVCEVHTSGVSKFKENNKKCKATFCYRATHTTTTPPPPIVSTVIGAAEVVKTTILALGQRSCTMIPDVDYAGDDLVGRKQGINAQFNAHTAGECEVECLKREDCKAFTHLGGTCYLKGADAFAQPNTNAISAICFVEVPTTAEPIATIAAAPIVPDDTTTTTVAKQIELQLHFPGNNLKDMSESLKEAQGGAVNGKLYVFGGFKHNGYTDMGKDTYEYNPKSGKWNTKKRIPAKWRGATHMANAVDTETNMIYLLGGIANYGANKFPKGSVGIADVIGFNAKKNRWTTLPSMPAARGGGAAVVLDNKLHFFNGAEYDGARGGFQQDTTDHWVLDLAHTEAGWMTLASNSLGRNHVGGVAWGGQIYAIGGQFHEEEGCTNQKIAEVYNPKTNTWSRIADLPIGTGHISPATLAHEHGIVVVGGVTDKNRGCSPPGYARNQLFFYNPTTDTWADLENRVTGASMVSGIINGDIYAQHGNQVQRINLSWKTSTVDHIVGQQSAIKHAQTADSLTIGDGATVRASKSRKVLLPAAAGGICAVVLVVGALFATRRTATVPTDSQSLTTSARVSVV